jgi:general nucleoside transport system permease protein
MNLRARPAFTAAAGMLCALIFGVVGLRLFGYDPILAFRGLWASSVDGTDDIAETLRSGVPLLLCALSASLAFACGPVNLGQPGQFVAGAMTATVGGLALSLPAALQIPMLCALGFLGGAGWAGIAAFCKRRLQMDEFIVTLMLNFIADYTTQWMLAGPLADRSRSSPMTKAIDPSGFLGTLGGVSLSVPIAAVVVIAVALLLSRTTIGYEWRMAGAAPKFARFGGVNTEANISWVMCVSGGLAGLGGALLVMSGPHRFVRGMGANFGWDGVMVAVVAANGIVATVVFAALFASLQTGAIGMNLRANVPTEAVQMFQAIVVLMTVVMRGLSSGVLLRWLAKRRAHASWVGSGR